MNKRPAQKMPERSARPIMIGIVRGLERSASGAMKSGAFPPIGLPSLTQEPPQADVSSRGSAGRRRLHPRRADQSRAIRGLRRRAPDTAGAFGSQCVTVNELI